MAEKIEFKDGEGAISVVSSDEINQSLKVIGKTFNHMAFKSLMEKFEVQVEGMKEVAKSIRVRGAESERKSIEMATTAKKLDKVIDKARMSAKRPYLDFNQMLDGMVRPIQKELKAIETGERKKCVSYRNDLLKKQREEEAKQAAAPAPKSFGGLKVGGPKPIKQAAAKVDSITAGSAGYKPIMVPHLVDISKVPAKYLEVNWKAVNAAVKDGVTAIEGFEFKEEMKMTARS